MKRELYYYYAAVDQYGWQQAESFVYTKFL